VLARFSASVQNGPGVHPASCTMGTCSFAGVKSGQGVTLTPHPPSSAAGHERVELYLYSPHRPYGLYRASVSVEGCTLLLRTNGARSPFFHRPSYGAHKQCHFTVFSSLDWISSNAHVTLDCSMQRDLVSAYTDLTVAISLSDQVGGQRGSCSRAVSIAHRARSIVTCSLNNSTATNSCNPWIMNSARVTRGQW